MAAQKEEMVFFVVPAHADAPQNRGDSWGWVDGSNRTLQAET